MENLVDKVIELVELAKDMTQEQYEHWKQETLQQCPKQKFMRAFLEEIFKVIEKYK